MSDSESEERSTEQNDEELVNAQIGSQLNTGFYSSSAVLATHEAKKVINHYEVDYKEDLALHLYSAHLLHRMDPKFPPFYWTAWPLNKDDVYDPKPNSIYTLDPEKMVKEYKQHKIQIPNSEDAARGTRKRKHQDDEEEVDEFTRSEILADSSMRDIDDGDDVDSESDSDEENYYDALNNIPSGQRLPAKSNTRHLSRIPRKTPPSDPTETLKVEIEALFKKKVNTKIYKLGNKELEVQPTVDHLHFPPWVFEYVKKKLDDLVGTFARDYDTPDSENFTYKDLLLQDTVKDRNFKRKVEKLFTTTSDKFLKDEYRRELKTQRLLTQHDSLIDSSNEESGSSDEEHIINDSNKESGKVGKDDEANSVQVSDEVDGNDGGKESNGDDDEDSEDSDDSDDDSDDDEDDDEENDDDNENEDGEGKRVLIVSPPLPRLRALKRQVVDRVFADTRPPGYSEVLTFEPYRVPDIVARK